LAELPNTQLVYFDAREELKLSIAGCYFVAGVDTAGNESFATNEICIDNCPYYEIPNVFTPNQDGSNDILLPFDYRFVNGIDMIIFNRWGMDVYKTTDIDIKWNGKDLSTQNDLPEGVYFYICKVQERYLDGIRTRTLKGTIQLIRK
jgi:gliding motility-associated-like protein